MHVFLKFNFIKLFFLKKKKKKKKKLAIFKSQSAFDV